MPRPQIVTWLERMQTVEKGDPRMKSQEKLHDLVYWKSRSYLGLVVCLILDSTRKMLSYSQIISKVMAFMGADRRRIEKPVNACLSSYSCFIKIPKIPLCPSSTDLWTVDKRRMDAVVRDHVKAALELFPGFSSNVSVRSYKRKRHAQTCFTTPVATRQSPPELKLFLKRSSITEWQTVPPQPASTNNALRAWPKPAPRPSVQHSNNSNSAESFMRWTSAGPQLLLPAMYPFFWGAQTRQLSVQGCGRAC
ncbi:uncharacterized protein LOC103030870 [Astyanax mexicanus]|uniref:uncharacterized protein LOC103030870 n=1 Tax=Astyanax mexicanus TaxID=7994 RepID=UPI0020CB5222|nr:uncharacterized protein LOC103030870 [Astyanax mexicanus]